MKNNNKPHPHDTRLHLMLWRYRKIKDLRAPSDKKLRRALLDEYKDEIKDLRRVLRETDDIARAEHDGTHGINVKLRWLCPICGAPRGEIQNGRSYDGSRVLFCNTWQNPCGHVDKYADVRTEAAANGLNGDVLTGGGLNDALPAVPADNRT